MKIRATRKEIMNGGGDIVRFGYCDIDTLFKGYGSAPAAYTCGVYGWNADIYFTESKTLVTGYRPFGRKPRLSYNEIYEYDMRARAITGNWDMDYDEKCDKLAALRREFIRAI